MNCINRKNIRSYKQKHFSVNLKQLIRVMVVEEMNKKSSMKVYKNTIKLKGFY